MWGHLHDGGQTVVGGAAATSCQRDDLIDLWTTKIEEHPAGLD